MTCPQDYNYNLPEELIAQEPAVERDLSRLLLPDGSIHRFRDIVWLLDCDDVLFFNNTRVLKARAVFPSLVHIRWWVEKIRDADIEIFFVEYRSEYSFEALISPGKWFALGDILQWDGFRICVNDITENGRILSIDGMNVKEFFDRYGNLPLPPYIAYDISKEARYQTVFASQEWALAAPTASLHFTQAILDDLAKRGIDRHELTLHVGLGTFKPIPRSEEAHNIRLHHETIQISIDLLETLYHLRQSSKHIVAVGTTVVRTLESLPILYTILPSSVKSLLPPEVASWWSSLSHQALDRNYQERPLPNMWFLSYDTESRIITASTEIFIYEPYEFLLVDKLITNFHLPESSLLMLVSAFAGREKVLSLYEKAVQEKMRFFSFGDAMFLEKKIW
jgi:S-adenosylmethionine:tRNA ribosyltransferase-isomerase